ncbi:MAG: arginine decarboxylase, pyruvoyl-dependent [Calditrichaeota bacterium]|nr:MAG: arginine decarboxylase, pyruvoyl-dependent [Calditrichota bacterium]
MYVPSKIFLTKGVGVHKEKLASFEMALRNAGIAQFNIVEVSSILPPNCRLVDREEGLKGLVPGQIIHVVLSRNATNEPHRMIAAAVGVAVPADRNMYGYLSEHHSFGEDEKTAGDYAEDLAASMLATILGVEFDPESSYDQRREIYRISGKIVESFSITQTAVGHPRGLWTTVVAASVLVP